MSEISLSDLRYDLPDHHRRWVRTGFVLSAVAYGTMSVVRLIKGDAPQEQELLLLACSVLAYVLEPKFPRFSTSAILSAVWMEMMWSLLVSSVGVRNPSSVTLPLVIVAAALLLGAVAAWVLVLITSLAVPLVLVVGQIYFDGPGIRGDDVGYLTILEIAIFGVAVLLTGFMRTLATLVNSEQANTARWRDFIEDAPDAIVAVNTQGKVVAFNRLAEEYLDTDRADVLGKPFASLQEKRPDCFGAEAMPSSRRPSQLQLGNRTLETRLRRETDGDKITQWLFVLRDVTEREAAAQNTKQLRSQLNHIQKMDAIGQLAGGVAHDFNNLLTAVSGAAFALQDSDDPESQEIGMELMEASQQGAALTRQLLTFARREVVQARVVALDDALERAKPLISRVLGERIALDIDVMPACFVRLDEGQFEQVVLNLAANARDATEGVGTFSFTLRCTERKVILRAVDSGCGMDEQTIEHIFEPFFTTKPSNQGTGLGLATIHGIVAQWDGTIRVDSAPGRGTTFTIEWPLAEEENTGVTRVRISTAQQASGKVLLVEDNEPARRFVKRVLDRAGYSVTEAGSAEEALTLCHGEDPPDILISDVIMPGITGVDLAKRLHEKWQKLPVLFVSGYVDDVLADWPYDTNRDLLLKPFSPADLLNRLDRKLKKRRIRPTTDSGSTLFDPEAGKV